MRNLARQFGAALFVTTLTSQAVQAAEVKDSEIALNMEGRAPISLPLCHNHKGEVVEYWIRSGMDDLAKAGYGEQDFYFSNGTPAYTDRFPYIAFNPDIISNYSDLAIKFVFEHECGHQVKGHIETSEVEIDPNQTIQERAQEELDADCYAVRKLKGVFTRQTLISTFARLFPNPAKGPEYADLETRTKKALACLIP